MGLLPYNWLEPTPTLLLTSQTLLSQSAITKTTITQLISSSPSSLSSSSSSSSSATIPALSPSMTTSPADTLRSQNTPLDPTSTYLHPIMTGVFWILVILTVTSILLYGVLRKVFGLDGDEIYDRLKTLYRRFKLKT
ncbi:hypothetical protein TWF970_009727 [Orbilia oligospora]|uniref:Uncharacterized protein n=1 Tax=Orbilia oligospora TaxID=2813651 RepID=A0A7C8VNG0_ORBOL|nr:hypothetical protein TWF970_009727 [Orbilia oligospora]